MVRSICLGLSACLLLASPALAGGEIHGTVTTIDGKTYTGPIRWDRNENFWDDVLNAAKDRGEKAEEGGTTIYIFGWKLLDIQEKDTGAQRDFTIPFGHIRSLEPLRGSRVQLTLKNGEKIEIRENRWGTDLGRSMRGGVVIYDSESGKNELDWYDLGRIDFTAGPGQGRDDQRLYGTVHTAAGTFTGFVNWDLDEALLSDELDGEEKGRDYEIEFREIREIQRLDDQSSRVILTSGRTRNLSGTNDVNRSNRGILVNIEAIGSVIVRWRDFEKVVFEPAPPSPPYESFDGGSRIGGTLTTPEGETYSGPIIWDGDETYTWEELDGEVDGVEYNILFSNIASIRPDSRNSAEVTLRNGDVLILSGSNDVNSRNDGIVVEAASGAEAVFDWDDFELVEFAGP
jgi:hypothetical protein